MKIILSFLFLFIGTLGFAQSQTSNFKVEGDCGMCKKTIEKAAIDAGAEKAIWNKKTKELKVKFDTQKTSLDKIKKQISEAGYANDAYKANEEAYQKLPECCHYRDKKAH